MDFDQSGLFEPKVRTYLGPSLGWVEQRVKPETVITTGGLTMLHGDASIVLVNVAAATSFSLPSVSSWMRQNFSQPATGFARAIWIKDLGGNASAFPIIVMPFGGEQLDGLNAAITIIQNFALLRLYPIFDLTGWFTG